MSQEGTERISFPIMKSGTGCQSAAAFCPGFGCRVSLSLSCRRLLLPPLLRCMQACMNISSLLMILGCNLLRSFSHSTAFFAASRVNAFADFTHFLPFSGREREEHVPSVADDDGNKLSGKEIRGEGRGARVRRQSSCLARD